MQRGLELALVGTEGEVLDSKGRVVQNNQVQMADKMDSHEVDIRHIGVVLVGID